MQRTDKVAKCTEKVAARANPPEAVSVNRGMKQQNRKRKRLPSGLAGSYDDADGMDPRFDPSPASEAGLGKNGDRRKLQQLCSQVLRALQLAWPTNNDILASTDPREVLPAPNSHNLLVLVYCNQSIDQVSDQTVLDAIAQHADFLRQQVARTITRKRAPRIAFAVIPRDPAEATG